MACIAKARDGTAKRSGRLKNTKGVTQGISDGPSEG